MDLTNAVSIAAGGGSDPRAGCESAEKRGSRPGARSSIPKPAPTPSWWRGAVSSGSMQVVRDGVPVALCGARVGTGTERAARPGAARLWSVDYCWLELLDGAVEEEPPCESCSWASRSALSAFSWAG